MKIIESRLLRGPNLYARQPCIKAVIDLEDLRGVSSADLPRFTERLCSQLPSLRKHRCSVGKPGGFVQRLVDGTYMAHIVEHVTLELQCLAGSQAGFGRTRAMPEHPGCYTVVCAYRIEALIVPALQAAMALVAATARGEPVAVEALLEPLRRLVLRHAIGPSTRAILDAAKERGIPTSRLTDDASLYQLGYGARQQRIQATITGNTSQIATRIASDKQLTRRLLQQAGIPVPRGVVVRDAASAIREARRLSMPVVVKPADANHGKGVRTALTDAADIARAFEQARQFSSRIIVEEFIEGADYRLLIIAGELVAASRREPPCVIGDGSSSIMTLISRLNEDPARGEGHRKALTRIEADRHTIDHLEAKGLTLESVPAAGERVVLRDNANLSTGGSAEDVTAQVHPDTKRACERASRQIGLDVAGVDLVCRDIAMPLAHQGAIIEINAAPGLRMHELPSRGEPRAVGQAIVRSLFGDHDDGRIPIVAVTGTNGKTTTSLLIGSAMRAAGLRTGIATTEGVAIDETRVRQGDCTGYWSARTILGSPEVEVAVLETARGGILKRGLGFDYCDVAVVLNVTADHLGLDGVSTVRAMARVKRVVARSARQAVVLNADDPHCAAMAASLKPGVETVYFAFDAANPVMQSHLARGGRGVFLADGEVVVQSALGSDHLFRADQLAVTLEGRAVHNMANVLAAVAALLVQGSCPRQAIIDGLRDFRCSIEQNPLRMNLSSVNGVTILHDYAHNPAAYRAILDTARAMGCRRIVGVITAPGDRRNSELTRIAKLCAAELDEIVLYEVDERRGRAPGETLGILHAGALAGARPGTPVHAVEGSQQAILAGFQRCSPGDLLLIGGATDLCDLALIAPREPAIA
ncbi:MAG: cyanophycin synthetase [Pigmentiphaga sp.]